MKKKSLPSRSHTLSLILVTPPFSSWSLIYCNQILDLLCHNKNAMRWAWAWAFIIYLNPLLAPVRVSVS
ncbi:hypothetical protein F5H01DRAFT_333126 [Linnemannia elongata]|nr:hypothetical protein F5H01DRAFT_333126 [Linnemannia elongata]